MANTIKVNLSNQNEEVMDKEKRLFILKTVFMTVVGEPFRNTPPHIKCLLATAFLCHKLSNMFKDFNFSFNDASISCPILEKMVSELEACATFNNDPYRLNSTILDQVYIINRMTAENPFSNISSVEEKAKWLDLLAYVTYYMHAHPELTKPQLVERVSKYKIIEPEYVEHACNISINWIL